MNKILKRLVGLFIIGIGILNMCDASNVDSLINLLYTGNINANNSSYVNVFNYGDNGAGTYCIKFTSTNAQTLDMGFANGGTTAPSNLYKLYNDQYGNRICLYGNKAYFNVKLNAGTNTINYEIFKFTDLLNTTLPQTNTGITVKLYDGTRITNYNYDITKINRIGINYNENETTATPKDQNSTIPSFKIEINTNNYIDKTSINTGYCTGHNLCPQCEQCEQCQTCPTIDAQYCMNNFNLIPPAYCPICGTGDVNWSSLYINGTQYNSNEMIDIHTENQMNIDVDYLNDTVDIDITYGQDETYLNTILSGTAMAPTKEDFAIMIGDGLTNFAPYLFIGLLMIYTIGLIKKFFRG